VSKDSQTWGGCIGVRALDPYERSLLECTLHGAVRTSPEALGDITSYRSDPPQRLVGAEVKDGIIT
jgi:hypothetical protein